MEKRRFLIFMGWFLFLQFVDFPNNVIFHLSFPAAFVHEPFLFLWHLGVALGPGHNFFSPHPGRLGLLDHHQIALGQSEFLLRRCPALYFPLSLQGRAVAIPCLRINALVNYQGQGNRCH